MAFKRYSIVILNNRDIPFITATYDLDFPVVEMGDVKRVAVREIPELQAFTLCFWIRLTDDYILKSVLNNYQLIEYRGSNTLETVYFRVIGEESDVKLEFVLGNQGGKQ